MNAEQHAEFYREASVDLAAMEAKIAELRLIARYHQEKAGIPDAPRIEAGEQPASARAPVVRRRLDGQYSRMKQIAAAEAVIREAGESLATAEIARRMIAGGFSAGNPKKLKTSLFTGMTRRPDTFFKTGPGMWNVKPNGEPVQEAT